MYRILKDEGNIISAEQYEEKVVNRAEVAQREQAIEQFEAQIKQEELVLEQKNEKLEAMKADLAEKLEIVRLADEAKTVIPEEEIAVEEQEVAGE